MENFSYFTVLSNWLVGYDKYQRLYSKQFLDKSSYPNEFYLLKENEFSVGINKAENLLKKLNIPNDQIIKINTFLDQKIVNKNTKTNRGWLINQNYVPVVSVEIMENGIFKQHSIEDLSAKAYNLVSKKSYSQLIPRSVSFLPIANACQARCWFCFSESSISKSQDQKKIDFIRLESILNKAKSKNTERFVITGGGEPGLLLFSDLLKAIEIGKRILNKTILITNGMFLSYKEESTRVKMLNDLVKSGLDVLSISYHHYDPVINKEIMGVDTKLNNILDSIKKNNISIKVRLICVLQKKGISDRNEILAYLNFARKNNIEEVCFKELYVASSEESKFSKTPENIYSLNQQVSLKEVLSVMNEHGFIKIKELPWGSPVFKKDNLTVAAYTEPSVGWELHHGICRSWNVLSDFKNYATLEDKNSLLENE